MSHGIMEAVQSFAAAQHEKCVDISPFLHEFDVNISNILGLFAAANPLDALFTGNEKNETMVNMQALQTGRSLFISSNTCNQYKCWARSVILCLPPRC